MLELLSAATSSPAFLFLSLSELRAPRPPVVSTLPPLSLLPNVAQKQEIPMPTVTHGVQGVEHLYPSFRVTTTHPRVEMRNRILSYLFAPPTGPSHDLAGNPILAPTEDAVKEALRFLDVLPPRIQTPHIGAADDGEINFSWTGDGVFIDVGFRGDGHIHYYTRVESKAIRGGDEAPFTTRTLPRQLAAALVSIAT